MDSVKRLILAAPVRAAAYLQAAVWLVGFGVQFAIYRAVPRIPDWIPILGDAVSGLSIALVLIAGLTWWQRTGIARRPPLSPLWLAALAPALLFGVALG